MKTIHTTAFIDWDSARRIVTADSRKVKNVNHLKRVIQALQRSLARNIARGESRAIFHVSMRIYHGWYRGKTPTQDRRALDKVVAIRDVLLPRVDRVAFSPDIEYGDTLLSDGRRRLWDTLRKRDDDGTFEQKMIDTAMVSDLLDFVRRNRQSLAVVVADDDDMLPGVFTADAWGGNVLLARVTREHENKHLDISKFVCRLERE